MIQITPPTAPAAQAAPAGSARMDAIRQAAEALEAEFLTEMLKGAGLGEARDAFGGGAGEEQFSGLLVREQAGLMARAGGIGLAESIVKALAARSDHGA